MSKGAIEAVPHVKNKHFTVADTRARIRRDNEARSLALSMTAATKLDDPTLKRLPKADGGLGTTLITLAIIAVLTAVFFYPVVMG